MLHCLSMSHYLSMIHYMSSCTEGRKCLSIVQFLFIDCLVESNGSPMILKHNISSQVYKLSR
ncbi:hypothetical protein B0O80DRAFT_437575 [Mortierella sp. GBAus27b]|nr:hypothetical protein B0O80DRAFT_437575 [Mortierella sp. GBAus27b]